MHREEEKRKKRRAAKYSRFHQPEGHKVYQWGESTVLFRPIVHVTCNGQSRTEQMYQL